MDLHPDFKGLLVLFHKHHVEYGGVGGYALAFHGAPRYTGDLDVFVRPSTQNATRILAALTEFGFGSVGLMPEDFVKKGMVIQLGVPPVRVDIITSLTGVSWEEVYSHRVRCTGRAVSVDFIGHNQFVTNKRALGRKKDLADLEALGEIQKGPQSGSTFELALPFQSARLILPWVHGRCSLIRDRDILVRTQPQVSVLDFTVEDIVFQDLLDLGIPLDIVVYTPKDFAEPWNEPSGFWRTVRENHLQVLQEPIREATSASLPHIPAKPADGSPMKPE